MYIDDKWGKQSVNFATSTKVHSTINHLIPSLPQFHLVGRFSNWPWVVSEGRIFEPCNWDVLCPAGGGKQWFFPKLKTVQLSTFQAFHGIFTFAINFYKHSYSHHFVSHLVVMHLGCFLPGHDDPTTCCQSILQGKVRRINLFGKAFSKEVPYTSEWAAASDFTKNKVICHLPRSMLYICMFSPFTLWHGDPLDILPLLIWLSLIGSSFLLQDQ